MQRVWYVKGNIYSEIEHSEQCNVSKYNGLHLKSAFFMKACQA